MLVGRFAAGVSYVRQHPISEIKWRYLVDELETVVVLESLERSAVTLPKEFEPRGDEGPICPVLGLISTDRAEEDAFGGLARLEIVHVQSNGLVGLFLRLLHFSVCELDEAVHDHLDGGYARILGDILVLHEAFLRRTTFAKLDTKLDESENDGFQRRERSRTEAFGREHLRERLEGGVGLADGDEALGLFEDRLRL